MRAHRTELLLVAAVLVLTVPFLRTLSTQPASRYLFTVAVVDDGTVTLDPYRSSLGDDQAIVDGRVISDKAPYQPFATMPVYWAYRAAGGDPFPADVPTGALGETATVGLWLVTLVSSALPAAALAVVIHRHAATLAPAVAAPVALALVVGTVVLPFGSMLFGHVLAALTGFAAWHLVRAEHPRAARLVGAGALLGASIGVEYPQIVVAAVVGVASIVLLRQRAAWVAAGGVLGIAPLLAYNSIVFGSPFTTAYQGHLPNFHGSGAFGVYNLVAPQPRQLGLALIGDRGLLTLTPVVLIALVACVVAIRRRTPARTDAVVALVLLAVFVLISTGIDGYGGSSPGPRYLVPIIPFFAHPLAEAFVSWRRLSVGAALWGAGWMVLATMTDPLYERGNAATIDWLRDAIDGSFQRTIPGELLGDPAALLLVPCAAACAVAACRAGARGAVAAEAAEPLTTLEAT